MHELDQLQRWYLAQCNDEWEHSWGVTIGTLDNPGWTLHINLQDTPLAHKPFTPITTDRTEDDWVYCKIKDDSFDGAGGPLNLTELIRIFLDWANSQPNT